MGTQPIAIDHFMYAVSDLDAGMAWVERTFDARPAYGGAHVGLGTQNALLSLGDTYLEIIAPDHSQDIQPGSLGDRISRLETGGMATWAVNGNLGLISNLLKKADIESTPAVETQRKTADDQLLVWQLMFTRGHPFGPRLPFFIDWLECPHPSQTNPGGGVFARLMLSTPDADRLSTLLVSTLGLPVAVVEGAPAVALSINTHRGEVLLQSTDETIDLSF